MAIRLISDPDLSAKLPNTCPLPEYRWQVPLLCLLSGIILERTGLHNSSFEHLINKTQEICSACCLSVSVARHPFYLNFSVPLFPECSKLLKDFLLYYFTLGHFVFVMLSNIKDHL